MNQNPRVLPHKAHGMRQPCSVPSPRQHCKSSLPSASWPSPSMHSWECITEQEPVSLPPSHQAITNEQVFHLNSSTCFLLLFSTLFFRPHCYEKYQLLKSHFPQKIFESCLITSLPPYFFKTVLPASRTRRKHKEKVLCKWGMFLGNACKALPRSHIIILLYFFCCCWSVFKGLDLPCSSNSNLKNIPSSNRDALGCTWDVLGIPALSRYSTAKPCREEVKLPCSPHKKATLL